MAEKLCMTVTGYGKIERGEVSVNQERLESICKVFGISISEIYDKPIDETVKSEIAYLRSLLMAKEEVIEALKKQILLLEKIKS
jgi:transcriptional regulator with XRE-family HTH domain